MSHEIILVHTVPSHYRYPEVITVTTLADGFAAAAEEIPKEIHIGGGTEIYREALPYTDRLHLTLVDSDALADTFFSDFENFFVPTKEHPPEQRGNLWFQWIDYLRKHTTH